MPFTTGSTRSSGYKILASDWNERVNNENWLGNADRCVAATSTLTTSLTDATWSSALTFSADDFDTGGFHSTSSNTSRLTVPTGYGGIYRITANVYAVNGSAGQFHLQIRKNASGAVGSGTFIAQHSGSMSTNAAVLSAGLVTCEVRLAATDYVEVFAMQITGGSVALAGTTQAHRFGMTWVAT